MHGSDKVVPAAAHLARRGPVMLGATVITPATREICGSAGRITVAPRIMHALLVLADARGAVVTRDELAELCWGGRFVAEDSLNGAIAELRRALRTASPDEVFIETVPRTGYRLVGPTFTSVPPVSPADGSAQSDKSLLTRRLLMTVGLTVVAGAGIRWWTAPRVENREAALLIERGSQALRQGLPEEDAQGVSFFKKAVQIDPENAKGWGMLALAWRAAADYGDADSTARSRTNSEIAAKRALAIDPRQSDALTALATLTPLFGDWLGAERRIRSVLAIDPENNFAVAALSTLLMSTGQVRKCLQRLNWLVHQDNLSPNVQFRRVYTLWSADQFSEMDRTADRALQSWPRHPGVWFARFWTFAFTDREAAARSMLTDTASRPAMPPPFLDLLILSLQAMSSRQQSQVEAAVGANLAAAPLGPGQATSAIMVLSHLGAREEAYKVAQGFLLGEGPLVVKLRHSGAQASVTDQHHKMAMMLWIPATRTLRLHPEFRSLCVDMGMVDFWRVTRTRPDFNEASLATI